MTHLFIFSRVLSEPAALSLWGSCLCGGQGLLSGLAARAQRAGGPAPTPKTGSGRPAPLREGSGDTVGPGCIWTWGCVLLTSQCMCLEWPQDPQALSKMIKTLLSGFA